jgi:acyl-homoserine lactone acylase PvdQ
VLPATWYFCHLECPPSPGYPDGIHAAGASVAGAPGLGIGRNRHVAWGFTNVMLDAADILVLRVDPRRPTVYSLEGREREMQREEITLQVRGTGPVSYPVYRSVLGPVLTAVEPGVEAVAVLRWYGTLPPDMLVDHTIRGIVSFLNARTAEQVLDAGADWRWLAWNILAADDAGHIGWHACGAAPVRRGYSGRLPADGSSGADWTGFVPYADMPHCSDPPEGWLATANQKITEEGASNPLSYAWYGPARHLRITSLLAAMDRPGVRDFMRLQWDVHSVQAERIVPQVLAVPCRDPLAREAQGILSAWDRELGAGSAGAALYECFLCELDRALLCPLLGADLSLYSSAKNGYSIDDVILGRPGSPLWAAAGGLESAVESCLARAVREMERRMGRDRSSWAWGRLHRYVFRHPGAVTPLLARLLNPAPIPAGGDCNTVNVSWYRAASGSFDATVIPSMRMIVPLRDPDGMRIIGPLGQSGQPGHRHYADMLGPWAEGKYAFLPMSAEAVEKAARERLLLSP